MSSILFEHATILTMDRDNPILMDSTLAVDGGEIVGIGKRPAGFDPDQTIDAGGCVIMPGLYNAHTHAAMTFARIYAEDLPLDRWFNERIWRLESAVTADIVYWSTMLAMIEMIRGGIVGFADMYFYMDEVARAVQQAGMRANLSWGVFGQESEVGITIPETLDFVRRVDRSAGGTLRAGFGPHSPYMCPDAFLARTAAVAVREGVGIHTHSSETEAQVKQSLQQYDMRPIEFLAHRGLFETETIVAHAIHINEVEITILAEKDVNVVQCPSTHMRYAMGVTPVPALLEAGVNVALGTDGAGSSAVLDLWREMRLAVLTQRQHSSDPTALGGDVPLRMATLNGAKTLGFPKCGVLRQGNAADLIVVNAGTVHFQPLHDIIPSLIWCTRPSDVRDVMVAGKWLMCDRQLLTIDEKEVVGHFQTCVQQMLDRPHDQFRTYDV